MYTQICLFYIFLSSYKCYFLQSSCLWTSKIIFINGNIPLWLEIWNQSQVRQGISRVDFASHVQWKGSQIMRNVAKPQTRCSRPYFTHVGPKSICALKRRRHQTKSSNCYAWVQMWWLLISSFYELSGFWSVAVDIMNSTFKCLYLQFYCAIWAVASQNDWGPLEILILEALQVQSRPSHINFGLNVWPQGQREVAHGFVGEKAARFCFFLDWIYKNHARVVKYGSLVKVVHYACYINLWYIVVS